MRVQDLGLSKFPFFYSHFHFTILIGVTNPNFTIQAVGLCELT